MGLFGGVKDAKPSFAANYVRQGHYLMRIDQVKQDRSRKGEDFVAVEMTCLFAWDDDSGKGHKPGETPSHLMMAKFDMFLPNMKAFIMAVMDCEEEEIDEDACEAICGEDQPFEGMLIELIAKDIVTRDKGNDFTRVDYKRRVPAAEVDGLISEKIKAKCFPDGALEAMVEQEA